MLGDDYRLIGLSRSPSRARQDADGPSYQWRKTDLFSRRQTIDALEGADLAVYLVHSLHPSARLTQGRVGDLDILCADNFARAAARADVKHIVYVSPRIPDDPAPDPFIASRAHVEAALRSRGTPVTALRTTQIIGPGSTGTEILCRLVERLPAMLLPAWTHNPIRPLARCDLLDLIAHLLPRPQLDIDALDVGGPQTTSFADLIDTAAELLERSNRTAAAPIDAPRLSTAWIRLWTGQPSWVIRPFIEQLRHPQADQLVEMPPELPRPTTSADQALQQAIQERQSQPSTHLPAVVENRSLITWSRDRDVRAVHSMKMPTGRHHDASWVAREYASWLPTAFRPFINVKRDDDHNLRFFLRPLPWPLLVLSYDEDVSRKNRQLFWITAGLLARHNPAGRLEFRTVLQGHRAIGAIHDFIPRLPWLLYLLTQAKIHHFVMRAFDRHLRRLDPPRDPDDPPAALEHLP